MIAEGIENGGRRGDEGHAGIVVGRRFGGRGGQPGETVDSVGGGARVDAGARQRLGRERKLELGARDRRRGARAEEGSREGNYRGVASHAGGGCRSTEPARTRVSGYGRCVRCDSAVGCGAGSLRWRWHWRSKTGACGGASLLMLAEMCLDEGGEGEREGDGRRDRITKRRGGLSSLDAGSRSWSWQWQWQLSLGAGGGMLCFAGGKARGRAVIRSWRREGDDSGGVDSQGRPIELDPARCDAVQVVKAAGVCLGAANLGACFGGSFGRWRAGSGQPTGAGVGCWWSGR
ncbi:hypothetical protein EDB80DRAFT_439390 [Ilyonectria destructans]|nr:hypothetical protein EDB80DRAFT_439390 [Ilyonectria destructans]